MNSDHGNKGNKNAMKSDKPTASVHYRCFNNDKDKWKSVSEITGSVSMTAWIIKTLNNAADKELKKHAK